MKKFYLERTRFMKKNENERTVFMKTKRFVLSGTQIGFGGARGDCGAWSAFTHGASRGFTLAEVLITLAIIGVIAVLSIGIYMPKIQSNVWAKQRFYVARSCL